MITEAETKEIEKDAKAHALQHEAARYFELKPTLRNIALQCSNESYIAGSTAMAEKKNLEIEASNVSIKIWKNTAGEFKKYNDELKAQLEATQEELGIAKGNAEAYISAHSKCCETITELQAEIEELKDRLKGKDVHIGNLNSEIDHIDAWAKTLNQITNNQRDSLRACEAELSRVKAVAEKMFEALRYYKFQEEVAEDYRKEALTEYQTLNEPKR